MFGIDFDPTVPTPMAMYVMQSNLDADNFLYAYNSAIMAGNGCDQALSYALEATDIDFDDLTDEDKERILTRIKETENSSFNTDERY